MESLERAVSCVLSCTFSPDDRYCNDDNLTNIYYVLQAHGVLVEDIIGADETGLEVIPKARRTLAPRGSRQVPGTAKKAAAQITKVTAMTFMGVLLPYMLIFAGKTEAVLPKDVVPAAGSCYTCTPSHFANAATTKEYVQKIIIPFVKAQRQARIDSKQSTVEEENSRWAVLIWDNFSAHADAEVLELLESHRIKPFYLPPNCTSVYQALDVLFNGVEKMTLKNHFSEWHFRQLEAALENDEDAIDVLPKSASKKRTLIAALVRGVHELMAERKALMMKAWDLTKLFDEDRGAEDLTDIGVNNDIIEAMRELTIPNAPGMEIEEEAEFEAAENATAPDADEHRNNFDLDDSEEVEQEQEQEAIEMEMNESDEEEVVPVPKRRCLVADAAANAEEASSSAESTHVVHLTRASGGRGLEVNFGSKARPAPERVVDVLRQQGAIPQGATLISSSNDVPNGFTMRLAGTSHATAAFNAPTLAWKRKSTQPTISSSSL